MLVLSRENPNHKGTAYGQVFQNPHGGEFASPYDIASIYAGLGDKDTALQWLGRADKERATMMPFVVIDPLLSPFRGDPRFQSVLRHVGVPQLSPVSVNPPGQ
jgi:hypothetical protein